MLNWAIRYLPFIRLLERHQAATVLDVGSGWYGLSWYWPRRVVQTDLSFSGVAPSQPRQGEATFVSSSAESLPFADDSFDFAVSSDMMEHLPMEVRAASVREMTRVARRGVLIGYPSGPVAATLDRRIARFLAWRHQPQPDWLQEHLEQESYPDRRTVADAVPPGWALTHEEPNGNALLVTAIIGGEMLRPIAPLTRVLERYVARRGLPAVASMGAPVRQLHLLQPVDH